MLQEMLTLMPDFAGPKALAASVIGAIAGLSLWLGGARFSRHMMSLLLTAVGAVVGLQLPKCLGWNMNGGGTSVALAVVCGVLGFLLHRFWVGLMLGLVMSFWTALTCWILLNNDQPLAWPTISAETTARSFAMELWQSLPADVTRIMPYAAGGALVSGICLVLLWPRLATVLNWSLVGLTLLLGFGIKAIVISQPQWMTMLPAQTWAQATAFLALIAFGAVVQWKLAPNKSSKQPAEQAGEKL
jgi:hypothetical protein